jgi:hypothetical protein
MKDGNPLQDNNPLKDYEPKLDGELEAELDGLDATRQSIAEAEGRLAELRASVAGKQRAMNLSEAAARIARTILPDNKDALAGIAEGKSEIERLEAFLPTAREMLTTATQKAVREILPALDLKNKAAKLRNHDARKAAHGKLAQALAELAKVTGKDEALVLARNLPSEIADLLHAMTLPEQGTWAELAQYEDDLAGLQKVADAKDAATASLDLRPFIKRHLK